ADATELPFEKITVRHGSTSDVKNGYGAYHSRSTVMGGSAILLAAEKLKDSVRATAALRFSCAVGDVTIDGEQVAHGGKTLPLAGLSDIPL
ncbi:MAG: Carbon-monoxide dehydrogenase, partial [Tardiphaga sp.]|nr:Carbon-monoxide dehydrogenase [Tardiphaga sp.]